MKSIELSLMNDKSVALPIRTKIFECDLHSKFRFFSDRETDCGLISMPMALRFSSFASTNVVPLPKKGSRIQSFGWEYRRIRFLGT